VEKIRLRLKNKKNSRGEDSVKRNAKDDRWGQLKLNRPHI
jgi:hypothetical protein